jgi:hypothetical protein
MDIRRIAQTKATEQFLIQIAQHRDDGTTVTVCQPCDKHFAGNSLLINRISTGAEHTLVWWNLNRSRKCVPLGYVTGFATNVVETNIVPRG